MKRLLNFIYGLMIAIASILLIEKYFNLLSLEKWYYIFWVIFGIWMFWYGSDKIDKAIE